MHFEKLRVENFGPFSRLELDLRHGSIGIFGRNGTGKSTLLNTLYALLTGDFRRFSGVKLDNVYNRAAAEDDSVISGVISHRGQTVEIERGIRGAGKPAGWQALKIKGEKTITSASGIQERLEQLLGVQKDVLDLFCFKEQDKVYDFLVADPAARARSYQTLCRTQSCEEIWNYLGEVLNKDAELRAEVVDTSDELTTQIRESKAKLEEYDAERNEHAARLLNDKSLASAQDLRKKRSRYEALGEQRDSLAAMISSVEAEEPLTVGILVEAQKRQQKLETRLRHSAQAAEAARTGLASWTQYMEKYQRRETLRAQAAMLTQREETAEEPKEVAGNANELREELAGLEAELKAAREALTNLGDGIKLVACPTCGSKVTPGHLEKHRKQLKEVTGSTGHPTKIARLRQRLRARLEYELALTAHQRLLAELKAENTRVCAELRTLETLKAPAGSREELQQVIEGYRKLEKESEAVRQATAKAQREADRLADKKKELHRQRETVERDLAENLVSDDTIEKVEKRLAEHLAATTALSRITGASESLRRSLAQDEEQLAKLTARLKRQKRIRSMIRIMTTVRDAVHVHQLPRKVAQHNLASIESAINREGLKLFGDPFWVEAQDDLTFLVHRKGAPPLKQGRLSTGQKVILAIAFWTAVGLLWRSEIGMLGLDEPTANLDEDNRRYLGEALEQLTTQVHGNRQVIIVTHDQGLRNAFDQVIDLDGA